MEDQRPTVSTARALEIVLSRVSMSPGTARDLAYSLNAIRRRGEPGPLPLDQDAARAALIVIQHDMSDVDASYPKAAMLSRIKDALAHIRVLLNG